MGLAAYLARRLLRMVPALFGITFVTFALMDLAPSSRAELALAQEDALQAADAEQRARQLEALREHWGMIDPETHEPYSLWRRYAHWLGRACTLDLAGPGEDRDEFHRRLLAALPVTLLVNTLALLLALGIGIPLGARLGMAPGGAFDRSVSAAMAVLYGLPEFLLATLLFVALGGGLMDPLLPTRGLRSDHASELPALAQAWDLAQHLILPVLTLAAAPGIVIVRFLRSSVARAARSDFVLALRALGTPEHIVRRRALRNGLSPLVTLAGTLIPALVGGSVVVESVFSLPGLGQLAFDAALQREQPMVMAMTLLVGTATLLGFLLSDVLHRVVDPRVELR
jgi:peptide/nickel transport system permease protein